MKENRPVMNNSIETESRNQAPATTPETDTDTDEDQGQPPQGQGEIGGPRGLEPTRYGDWEKGGRCIDF